MLKDQKNIQLVERPTLLTTNTIRMEYFITIIKELASHQGKWNML